MPNISDRLDSFPEAWKPNAGDKLVGELVDVDLRQSDYGDPYPILTILDTNGHEWAWHAFHTIARNEVAKKRPQVGETVGVSYHGKGKAAAGMNAPERWRFIVEGRGAATVDWDALGASSDEPEEAPAADDDGVPF